MTFRLYLGPAGVQDLSPIETADALYKEFRFLDDALSFARHLKGQGRVALKLEGDDGTRMSRREIAAAIARDTEEGPEQRVSGAA